jgi:radical SAM protein with 4Fe4S-binding SPASM domain
MHDLGVKPVEIRPKIGVRRIGKKLCLSNLDRGESWMCSGSSPMIWQKLQQGAPPEQIAAEISQKYGISREKVLTDVLQFVEHLWERQVLDLPERKDISNEQRAQLVKEQPHNVSQRVAAAAVEAERLCTCVFDLLVPCNLRCRHCYLDFSHTDVMPFADVCNYLDQLADHGCPEVTFTGGEIFLRRDFIDIVAHAEHRGFLINMITNGTFITQQKADELAKYALQTVKMSIYGSAAPLHEAVTKKAGTFEKTVNAAKLLIERGITVDFAYFVQNHNFKDAFEFPKFARKMGAKYSFDTKLVPNRNGSKDPLQYGVTVQQQAELFRSSVIHREVEFVCTAAASKARITASADVYPCELINTASLGNLKRQTLAEIWDSPYRAEMRAAILGYKPKRCGGCNHTADCEPCAAMRGFNQEGHMEAPVSEACLLTTASLLAQGKVMEPSSPFQKFAESCIDQVLAADQNSGPHHNLVQIMTARIEGT